MRILQDFVSYNFTQYIDLNKIIFLQFLQNAKFKENKHYIHQSKDNDCTGFTYLRILWMWGG